MLLFVIWPPQQRSFFCENPDGQSETSPVSESKSPNWAKPKKDDCLSVKDFQDEIPYGHNYGNEVKNQRIHYYNIAAAFVIKTTRIALNFGKTKEGILCIGGVCRSVPASYGFGLSVTTSF